MGSLAPHRDLHAALKTSVLATASSGGTQFIQVRLQNGKDDVIETLHGRPNAWTSAGIQETDWLSFLSFQRSPCAFHKSECYVREVTSGFDLNAFAAASAPSFREITQAAAHLEACGVHLEQPEGWAFFHNQPTDRGRPPRHVSAGDGHTSSTAQRLKETADDYFSYVLSWMNEPHFKGWITHYRPKNPPLSAEFQAALDFLGGFQRFDSCPQFEFEPCRWHAFPAEADGDFGSHRSAQYAHMFFDAHASHFSPGVERLLAAHALVAPFGFSFLSRTEGGVKTVGVAPARRSGAPLAKMPAGQERAEFVYDVAISFAGTERDLAKSLADQVVAAGFKVFYDGMYPEQLWGKDLAAHFDRVYRKESRFCAMFVSAEYATRAWTVHERRSAQARMISERGNEYILPIQIDGTDLDGLAPTIGYLSIKERSIQQIGELLIAKLRAAQK